jgi:prolyl oligopeptidase
MDSMGVAKSHLLINYMQDGTDKIEVFDHEGNYVGKLPIPEITMIGMRSDSTSDEAFYQTSSMVDPGATYRVNLTTLETELYHRIETPHNPEDFSVVREWVTSPDGTKLPLFLAMKKSTELNGDVPTILYGYGGFAVSEQPEYIEDAMAWVANGGIYGVAVLRGGGEYGESWHQAGALANKQNTFDDFIAHAEFLIENGYTHSKKLSISGGSNGGLLVGAVMTQRPELCGAVVCQVPLLDMLHYSDFLIGSLWIQEYGDPKKPEEFAWISQYSPYQNVSETGLYPPIYLTTGENDTRVHPMHAFKMAAKLQAVAKPPLTLLSTDRTAGHKNARRVDRYIEAGSKRLAFLASQLGLQPFSK